MQFASQCLHIVQSGCICLDIYKEELLSSLSQNSKYLPIITAHHDSDNYRLPSCHTGVVQCGVD